MGACFLEIHSQKTTYEHSWTDRKANIVTQGYAIIFDKILPCMPKTVRPDFPILQKINFDSGYYNDEDLILTPKEARALKNEFDRICRIYNYQEFIGEMDSKSFRDFLEGHFAPNDLVAEIKDVSGLVNLAAQNQYWIRITR